MFVTMGCLPMTSFYFFESTSFVIRLVILFLFFNAYSNNAAFVVFVGGTGSNKCLSFSHSNMDIELEIKDPDLLVVPSFCVGQALVETPEGTINSFLNEFM